MIKKYRDSLLSILCVISWFVIVYRIFNAVQADRVLDDLILTYLINTSVGIVGGIVLIFVGRLKRRKMKYSFMYNLFGTFNLVIGLIGMVFFTSGSGPSPYIVSACLCIGVIMYRDIYYRKEILIER